MYNKKYAYKTFVHSLSCQVELAHEFSSKSLIEKTAFEKFLTFFSFSHIFMLALSIT